MKKKLLAIGLIFFALTAISALCVFADDEPAIPDESGVEGSATPASDDSTIEVGTVDKQNTDDEIGGGVVEAMPTKTPKPRPTATSKPTPKPKKKAAPRATATDTPVPTPTVVLVAEFTIANTKVEELAKKRTAENFYGLFDREKKISVLLTLQSTGSKTLTAATAEMKSGHQRLIVTEPVKDLTTVLPGDKRELVFNVNILGDYDGVANLPLTLLIKAQDFEKEYPLAITVELESPYMVYIGIGAVAMLIIILLVLAIRGGGKRKKEKEYDFDIK